MDFQFGLSGIPQGSKQLLAQFDEYTKMEDAQQRGYLLQEILAELFKLNKIQIHNSFTRNGGAEQIDGAFYLEGWHYLVECRWRKKLADIRELDGLKGQIDRSGRQTMGLFISINGWSENVPSLLKQNPDKSIILIDGQDLRAILEYPLDLKRFILTKASALNLKGDPLLSAPQYLDQQGDPFFEATRYEKQP